jgi:hypothetical protein
MKITFAFLLWAMFLGASGLMRAQQVPADAAAAMAQAMAALGQAAEKRAAAGAIDAKALRALLPGKDAYAGFKRVKAGTESNAAMGFKVVVAKAEFEALEGDAGFSVQFSDIGGLGALAKLAVTMQEVDEETETGFRRTASHAGFKALEEYDSATKSGKVQIYPGDRVSVEVDAHGMSFDAIRQAIAKIDLKKLAVLKATAAPAADK